MIGIRDTQDIAGVLYQSILEPGSGADKRSVMFSGKSDGLKRTVDACILSGGCPNCMKRFQDSANSGTC